MGAIALSCLLSGGIGLIAGRHYSVMGLLIASNLLFIAVFIASFAAGTGPWVAAGLAILVVLTFNGGLLLGLFTRANARPAVARNLHKTLLDR